MEDSYMNLVEFQGDSSRDLVLGIATNKNTSYLPKAGARLEERDECLCEGPVRWQNWFLLECGDGY
ncbi:hypothetical protein LEMLEM_LOCUS22655 [Lemmus lemmus]